MSNQKKPSNKKAKVELDESIIEDVGVVADVLVSENKVKLNISTLSVLTIPEGVTKVEVENMGAGDLFVDSILVDYVEDMLVRVGEVKIFEDIKSLLFVSTSRPTALVRYYK